MIQCFVRKNYVPPDDGPEASPQPQLLYVSKVNENDSIHPRVMHKHTDYVEVVLIVRGQAQFSIGGRQLQVREGDLIIYNAGVVHDEVSGPDIQIATFCAAIAHLALPGLEANALIPENQHPIFSSGEHFASLLGIYSMMFDQLTGERNGCEIVAHHLMRALLAVVWEILHGSEAPYRPEDEEPLPHRIRDYLDRHYAEDIRLQDLADTLNISAYYLAHVFKDCFGYSPMQYILRRRIGEAQTLLISTDLSVTEIASRVGYDNPSHFIQLFTKNVGLPPRKYKVNYVRTEFDKQ